jgi:hypothetical protein
MRRVDVFKTCERLGCGRQYRTKPSHAARRRFCSTICSGLMMRRRETRNCALCGVSLGERPLSSYKYTKHCLRCAGRATGITHKKRGYRPVLNEESRRKWLAALQSKENRDRTSKLHKGRKRTTPLAARFSPIHIRARHFLVSSPARRIYRVDNISAFVRSHQELFLPGDTVDLRPEMANYSCHATHGLATVGRGFRGSWKGWTLVE